MKTQNYKLPLHTRLAYKLQDLKNQVGIAESKVSAYCKRYGATGSKAHLRLIEDYMVSGRTYSRAHNYVLGFAQKAGLGGLLYLTIQ